MLNFPENVLSEPGLEREAGFARHRWRLGSISVWLVQGTGTVCSAFLCNENKKLGLLTPAPVFFDFIFLLPGLSSLHLCLGILGHKSTNDRRKWTKSHPMIGNPVNNLNIVVDTS